MGWWDDFTGASSRKDLSAGRDRYRSELMSGRDLAIGDYNRAADEFSPYTAAGAGATTRWADLMGLNGDAARTAAQASYTSDPMFRALGDRAMRGIARGVASTGQTGAGVQAGTNAMIRDYTGYLDRLSGGSGMGLQAASGRAGMISRGGDARFLTGQQLASGEQSFANAMAQSRNTLTNNLLGLGSLAVSAYTGMPMRRPQTGANLLPGGVGASPY